MTVTSASVLDVASAVIPWIGIATALIAVLTATVFFWSVLSFQRDHRRLYRSHKRSKKRASRRGRLSRRLVRAVGGKWLEEQIDDELICRAAAGMRVGSWTLRRMAAKASLGLLPQRARRVFQRA